MANMVLFRYSSPGHAIGTLAHGLRTTRRGAKRCNFRQVPYLTYIIPAESHGRLLDFATPHEALYAVANPNGLLLTRLQHRSSLQINRR
jgi:hypothetical protein